MVVSDLSLMYFFVPGLLFFFFFFCLMSQMTVSHKHSIVEEKNSEAK